MYVLLENGLIAAYPYTIDQLWRDNPQVSFPAQIPDERLADWGVFRVQETPQPGYDETTQTLVENQPAEVNGRWVQVWEVQAASAAEITARKEAIKQQIADDVQQRLDAFAQSRGYDSIVSACSYATSQHPKYGPEGRYCVSAREQTWDALFAIEADVLAGTRPMPTGYDDIKSELPALVWPQ